ncbi:hypothetical protein B0T16DRAFT_422620 [Cercophora newfieldiana]|uniref:Uncharacterized protein n=1 Tax=Cercophora newfieldiana TaxID=92897 RepID=A0AA39XSA5_9PEZI|nr:hypothetical protein B0T16DRAFT_422620 [Cercophora newfieldiana]
MSVRNAFISRMVSANLPPATSLSRRTTFFNYRPSTLSSVPRMSPNATPESAQTRLSRSKTCRMPKITSAASPGTTHASS